MILTLSKKAEIISRLTLFEGLASNYLEEIAGLAVEKRFKRGEIIFTDGDPCNGFYIVIDGTVKIFKISPEGKEQIFHILGHGEPFGEVPVFTGQPFPANAEVLKSCHLVFLPREAFVALIANHPSLALNMLAIMSLRLRQFTVQVENISLKEVPGRIAAYLLYLSEEQDNLDNVSLTISKGHLASLLGTIPETLSRILSKMTGEKLIKVNGRHIQLLDYDGLAELSVLGKI